jgi:hypothetical protein
MKEHAFPSPVDPKTGTNQLGMTLRDYFAAMALQSLLAIEVRVQEDATIYAETAYRVADAMLEIRK